MSEQTPASSFALTSIAGDATCSKLIVPVLVYVVRDSTSSVIVPLHPIVPELGHAPPPKDDFILTGSAVCNIDAPFGFMRYREASDVRFVYFVATIVLFQILKGLPHAASDICINSFAKLGDHKLNDPEQL